MAGDEDAVMTIILYVLGHRFFLIALNMVLGLFFLLFIYSIPWLRRHGISYNWFRLFERGPSGVSASSHMLQWNSEHTSSSSSRRPLSQRSSLSTHPLTSTFPNSLLQSLEDGILQPARALNSSRVTPFTDTEAPSSLSRNGSGASKRSSVITTTTLSRRQRLEPLRRSFTSGSRRIVPDNADEGFRDADIATGSTLCDPTETSALPSSSSILLITNPNTVDVDLSDVRLPETPTTASIIDEELLPETPGRNRPPTYGTTFSQHSFMTLPLYRENEDDRMSVASRAPTYRSIIVPRSPHRSTRPPLPVAPSSFIPRTDLGRL